MPLATVGLILILPPGIFTSVEIIYLVSTPYIMQAWGFSFSQNIYFFLPKPQLGQDCFSLRSMVVECSSYLFHTGQPFLGDSFSLDSTLPTSTETQGHPLYVNRLASGGPRYFSTLWMLNFSSCMWGSRPVLWDTRTPAWLLPWMLRPPQ